LYLNDNQLQSLPDSILSLSNLYDIFLQNNPLSPSTLAIKPSQISSILSRRNFLKCYFALALACSFPVIESLLVNTRIFPPTATY
jgi:Leucine-rich repeat (LRR) protein